MSSAANEQKKDHKKKALPIVVAIISGMIIAIAASAYLVIPGTDAAIITERNGGFYRANPKIIAGKFMIISARSESVSDRKGALAAQMSSELSVVKMDSVAIIDFNVETPADEPDKKNEKTKKSSPSVVGAYAVNVSGHRGTMSIFSQNGRLEGYIQFPNWANGARETLKKIKVNGNTLYFTRSVETAGEQKRTGAPAKFVQNFEGEITNSGKTIKGFFSNHGGKEIWQAERK
jgi:hypothetical protein